MISKDFNLGIDSGFSFFADIGCFIDCYGYIKVDKSFIVYTASIYMVWGNRNLIANVILSFIYTFGYLYERFFYKIF